MLRGTEPTRNLALFQKAMEIFRMRIVDLFQVAIESRLIVTLQHDRKRDRLIGFAGARRDLGRFRERREHMAREPDHRGAGRNLRRAGASFAEAASRKRIINASDKTGTRVSICSPECYRNRESALRHNSEQFSALSRQWQRKNVPYRWHKCRSRSDFNGRLVENMASLGQPAVRDARHPQRSCRCSRCGCEVARWRANSGVSAEFAR